MRVLTASAHGIIDYVMVVALALAPTLFQFSWVPATIAYVLAAVHLLVSLATRYPLGVFKRIPYNAHGLLEVVVSVALVALPWLLGFSGEVLARSVYVCLGILLFVVWLLSDYCHAPHAVAPP